MNNDRGIHAKGCGCPQCRPVGPGLRPLWKTLAADLFYILITAAAFWLLVWLAISALTIMKEL